MSFVTDIAGHVVRRHATYTAMREWAARMNQSLGRLEYTAHRGSTQEQTK